MTITNNQKMDNGYYIKFDKGFVESLYATQGEIGKEYYFTILNENNEIDINIPQNAVLEMTIEMREGVAKFEGTRDDNFKPNTFKIVVPQKALQYYGDGKYQIHLKLPDNEKYIATRKGNIFIARNMLFDNGDINFFFDFEDILNTLKSVQESYLKIAELQEISDNHLKQIDEALTQLNKLIADEEERQKAEVSRRLSEEERVAAEQERQKAFIQMTKKLEELGLNKYDECFKEAEVIGTTLKFTRANGSFKNLILPSGGVTNYEDLQNKPDLSNLDKVKNCYNDFSQLADGSVKFTTVGGGTKYIDPYKYENLQNKPDLSNLDKVNSAYMNASFSGGTLKLTRFNGGSNSLDIGEKIETSFRKVGNYELSRVGTSATCNILKGTVIANGKLSTFLPSEFRPRTTTNVSIAYHNNKTSIVIYCFKIWTDGEIYCTFTTLGNDGTIITNRDSGTIQENITITFNI